MQRRPERVEVVHGPEERLDGGEVGDVVAKVSHRRREDRTQPHRADAQLLQVVRLAEDSWKQW